MADLNRDKSPFDRVLNKGLRAFEKYGVPGTVTGSIQRGLDTAQEKVGESVQDLRNFSAAGFLRASVTEDFLLDQLNGKQFNGLYKANGVQAAVPLLCTIVREEDEAKIYGVDAGGEKKVWGSIKIEGIQRFKGRAAGLHFSLDPGITNDKTLTNLNKSFKDDSCFGQIRWLSFDIDDGMKAAIESEIRKRLGTAPVQMSELESRQSNTGGEVRTEYLGQSPRRIDISTDEEMGNAAESFPELKKLCVKLSKFAEKAGFKGPYIKGEATTNGWWVFNSLGLLSITGWGINPRYQESKCTVESLRLRK